jgi:hypothetical protein
MKRKSAPVTELSKIRRAFESGLGLPRAALVMSFERFSGD